LGLTFEEWLVRRGRKPPTIHNHRETLQVIKRQIKNFTKEELDQLVVKLINQGLRNGTINHYIDTIRVYSQFMGYEDLQNFKHIKHEVSIKATFTNEEIEKFLALKTNNKTDLMFWKLVIFTGARLGEIAHLTVDDVDFERNILIIRHTKTGMPRQVPIAQNLQFELRQYVDCLSSSNLFVTSRHKLYSYACWQHSFSWRLKQLCIKRVNLTPYSFRHSFITTMLSEDVSPFKVAKQCGNSPEVIAKTYEHLVVKDLQEAIKRHPLVRKALSGKDTLNFIETYIQQLNLSDNDKLEVAYSRNDKKIVLTVGIK
jgi:integrase